MEESDNYSIHPLQLALRFILEVVGIIAYAVWGWAISSNAMAIINAILIPGFVAVLWGVFNVPGDKSRSGTAVIKVKGWVRICIELAVFGGAAYAMVATGKTGLASMYLAVTIIHYLMTLQRVRWLLSK